MKKGDIVEFGYSYPVGFAASIPIWANPPRDGEINLRGVVQDFLADDQPIVSIISEDGGVWFTALDLVVSDSDMDGAWQAGDGWDRCEDCRPGAPCRYHIATPEYCRAILQEAE